MVYSRPAPFTIVNGIIHYENKYGVVELEPCDYVHISKVFHATTPSDLKFDTDTAEKIALITGNARIQLVPNYPTNCHEWLVCHHSAPDTCAVCRVRSVTFTSPVNPREEIAREACPPSLLGLL